MKQRRKVKSLLSHKRYGSNFLLTALLLILSVMLCIGSVSLMTMRVFAADNQITSIPYEGLDDNTEVVYNVDFINSNNLKETINKMKVIGKTLYVGPNPVIVNVVNTALKNTLGNNIYANILGGFKNKVYGNNVTLIAGSGNAISNQNDNVTLLGGEGNKINPGNGSKTPAVIVGGKDNKVGTGGDGVGIIGGENNGMGQSIVNSFILGGSGNKIIGSSKNVIVGGKNVEVNGTNNVFVYSNDDSTFTPKTPNAFYLNTNGGVGINIESKGRGISVGGAVNLGEIDPSSITCGPGNYGLQGVYSGCVIGCTVAGKNAGGKWEMLDRGEKCKETCKNKKDSRCAYTGYDLTYANYVGYCLTGNIDIENMHECDSEHLGAEKDYRNVVFEANVIPDTGSCDSYTNRICLYQCDTGYELTGVNELGKMVYKCGTSNCKGGCSPDEWVLDGANLTCYKKDKVQCNRGESCEGETRTCKEGKWYNDEGNQKDWDEGYDFTGCTTVGNCDAYLYKGGAINEVLEYIMRNKTDSFTFVRDHTGDSISHDGWTSISEQGAPVYVGTGKKNKTIYYYTRAVNIYMNEDSSNMFESLPFSKIDISDWSTTESHYSSGVTNMSSMFAECSKLETIKFGNNWDVSHVKDMSSMFEGCSKFTSFNFSNWNTKSLTNMANMFKGCSNLKTIEFGDKWNTSSVTDMQGTFHECKVLTDLDFSKGNWNTSNVEYMANMFNGCSKLKTIKVDTGFVTDKVTDDGENMFVNDKTLKGGQGTTYNNGHINIEYARIDCLPLRPGYFSSDNYGICDDIAYLITGTDINDAMTSLAGTTGVITKFEKSPSEPGLEVHKIKISIKNSPEVNIWYDNGTIYYYTLAKKMYLNPDSSHMFEGLNQLSYINMSEWDTSIVENMKGMFSGCSSLQNFDFSKGIWNTSKVFSMEGMFNGCSGLTSLDFSKGTWKTSKVENMSSMFRGCLKLQKVVFDKEDGENWDTSSVTNMAGMFDGCFALTGLDLSNFDTYELKFMDKMFYKCENLETIYATEEFNVGGVLSGNDVFTDSIKLKGGAGTTYDSSHVDKEYARIDCRPEKPGYFTSKGGNDSVCNRDCISLKKGRKVNEILKRLRSGSYEGDFLSWDDELGTTAEKLRFFATAWTHADDFGEYAHKILPWKGSENDVPEYKKNIALSKDEPVRVWYDKDSKTIYYYPTGSKNICLNKNSSQMFFTLPKLQEVNISGWDRTYVNNVKDMFIYDSKLTDISFGHNWTTTKLTNMGRMFKGCFDLKSLDLSGLDTSNVTDMGFVFNDCRALTGLDLSTWKTDNVTNMRWMFWNAKNLKVIDLTNWDTSNVRDMEDMFINCKNLKTIYASNTFDASQIRPYVDPFLNDTNLVGGCGTSYSDEKSKYNTTKASQVKYAKIDEGPDSDNPGYFTSKDIIVLQKGKDVNSVIKNKLSAGVEKIMLWTGDESGFSGVTKYNIALDLYDKVRAWYDNGVVYYYPSSSEKKVYLNPDSSNMFEGLSNLTEVSMSGLDLTYLTNVSAMFSGDSNLVSVIWGNSTVSSIKNMSSMFKGCSSLTSLDLSSWKTSKVENMSSIFEGCSELTNLDLSSWRTSNVTNMSSMFKGCPKLQSINFGNDWITFSVKNMSSMFKGCSELTNLDLSSWYTNNVKNMSSMFEGCSKLTSLDLSSWDTSMVTDMSSMFNGCSKLTSLSLSSWDTSKVKNVSSMFEGCSGLTSLGFSNGKWNALKVDMSSLFKGCSELTILDLSSWKTINVEKMSSMFNGCSKLSRIYASSDFNVNNVKKHSDMFKGATKLVGGNGTTQDDQKVDRTYARIDKPGQKGYFTALPQ